MGEIYPKENTKIQKKGEMVLIDVHKDIETKKVLDGVSLEVASGSLTCICGPTGCGKTTIMSIMAGYQMPDKGKCLFNGAPVTKPSIERLVVFQESGLFPWKTLWENTLFGPRHQGKDLKQAAEKAKELITLSGLQGFENKYPGHLSGGMQRRAELIRALINEPKILLLDAPFRGLDAMTRGMMQEHFMKVFDETKTTMFLITDQLEEAIYLGDTVYLLSALPGRIKEKITVNLSRPRNVKQQSSEEFGRCLSIAYKSMEEEAKKIYKLLMSKKEISIDKAKELFK